MLSNLLCVVDAVFSPDPWANVPSFFKAMGRSDPWANVPSFFKAMGRYTLEFTDMLFEFTKHKLALTVCASGGGGYFATLHVKK